MIGTYRRNVQGVGTYVRRPATEMNGPSVSKPAPIMTNSQKPLARNRVQRQAATMTRRPTTDNETTFSAN